jgi:crossover junction endodeoxyribonuclease RuvC
MKELLVCGIDPGNKGGISFCKNGNIIAAYPMPIHQVTPRVKTYTYVDFGVLSKIISEYNPDVGYIELVAARPGQGVTSMFSFGFSTGGIHGVFATKDIPLNTVDPQIWKAFVLDSKSADKNDAIAFCEQNCPNISLLPTKRSKSPSDGIADAICISVFGYAMEQINNINTQKGE